MEYLIKEAFIHIEGIGPHVAEGHYDLLGPHGEIILPHVWETVIEPDWTITMHMWPMPEPKEEEPAAEEEEAPAEEVVDEGLPPPPPPAPSAPKGMVLNGALSLFRLLDGHVILTKTSQEGEKEATATRAFFDVGERQEE